METQGRSFLSQTGNGLANSVEVTARASRVDAAEKENIG
jgi:hypothetical protein